MGEVSEADGQLPQYFGQESPLSLWLQFIVNE